MANGAVSAFPQVVAWAASVIGQVVSGIGDLAGTLLNLAVDAVTAMANGAVSAFAQVLSWAGSVIGDIVSGIGDLAGSLLNLAVSAVTSMYNGFTSTFGQVVSWAAGIPGSILDAIGNITGALWDTAVSAMSSFWDGLKSVASSIISWAAGIAGQIASALNPFGSPKRRTYYVGVSVIESLAEGMHAALPALHREVANVAASLNLTPAMASAASIPAGGNGVNFRDIVVNASGITDANATKVGIGVGQGVAGTPLGITRARMRVDARVR
jgi:phage-related protein